MYNAKKDIQELFDQTYLDSLKSERARIQSAMEYSMYLKSKGEQVLLPDWELCIRDLDNAIGIIDKITRTVQRIMKTRKEAGNDGEQKTIAMPGA